MLTRFFHQWFYVSLRICCHPGVTGTTYKELAREVPSNHEIHFFVQKSVSFALPCGPRQHFSTLQEHAREFLFFRKTCNILVLLELLCAEFLCWKSDDDEVIAILFSKFPEEVVLPLRSYSFACNIHTIDHFPFKLRKIHDRSITRDFFDFIKRIRRAKSSLDSRRV